MSQTVLNCSASSFKSTKVSSDATFIDSVVMAIQELSKEWVAVESVVDASILALGSYGLRKSDISTNTPTTTTTATRSGSTNVDPFDMTPLGDTNKGVTASLSIKDASTVSYRLSIILESTSYLSPEQCYNVMSSEMNAFVASGQFTSALRSNAIVHGNFALAAAVAESSGYYTKVEYSVTNGSPAPSISPTIFSSRTYIDDKDTKRSISASNIIILVTALSLILAASLMVYFRFVHKSDHTTVTRSSDRGFMLNLFGRSTTRRPVLFSHLEDVSSDDFDAEMEGDDEVLWMDRKTQLVSTAHLNKSSGSSSSSSSSSGAVSGSISDAELSGGGAFSYGSTASNLGHSSALGIGGSNSTNYISSSSYSSSSSSSSSGLGVKGLGRRGGTHAIGTIDIY
jgi:hypothetical protein